MRARSVPPCFLISVSACAQHTTHTNTQLTHELHAELRPAEAAVAPHVEEAAAGRPRERGDVVGLRHEAEQHDA